ncbi:hypothetical protein ACJX0J_006221, partial [Zea mays]
KKKRFCFLLSGARAIKNMSCILKGMVHILNLKYLSVITICFVKMIALMPIIALLLNTTPIIFVELNILLLENKLADYKYFPYYNSFALRDTPRNSNFIYG